MAIVIAAVLLWITFTTLWLWRNQERVVFQPPIVDVVGTPLPATRVEFAAADGHRVFGYLVRSGFGNNAAGALVIAFHGNADLAAWLVPWAHELVARTGVAVLLPEYRGYAGIPGPATYATADSDARGALEFARRELRCSRLVLFGHSLGTAVAADLAAAMHPQVPGALVLQSPFTSARDMATRMLMPTLPWLWRALSRVHYDTRVRVRQLHCPVWVVHGARDRVVPVRMGKQVYASARLPAGLLIVAGAGHNDVAEVAGERYWRWIGGAVTAGVSAAVGELEEERYRHLP